MTNEGLLPAYRVFLHHKLINENGKLVDIDRIIHLNKECEDVYKVKVANTYRSTTFTKEHPILCSKKITKYCTKKDTQRQYEFDFKYKTVDKLSTDDWIRVSNVYKKEHFPIKYFDKWDKYSVRVDRRIDNPIGCEDFW